MDTSWSEAQAARWQVLVGEVRRRLGPGAALSPTARRFFQGHLAPEDDGTESVMVHRGPFAGFLTTDMQAAAATVDGHVLGDEAGLSEDTGAGAALLGHELVHAGTRVQLAPDDDAEDDAEERRAESMESMVGELVDAIETDASEEDERPARLAPVNTTALAEHVYRRLVTQVRRDRERGAW
jgi:hypothetical protein